jgi:superfamily II DNA/RNA helicase
MEICDLPAASSASTESTSTESAAPTRELAIQIEDEFIQFAKNTNLTSVLCIGGLNIERQAAFLRRKHNFVIATPGRLLDLENRRDIRLHEFTSIVLDEVDRMLDMGFIRDIKFIIARLPQKKHSLFFSATLPDATKEIMKDFLNDPITISIKSIHKTSGNVEQDVVHLEGRQKIDVLHDLLIKDGFSKVLVFGRTKHGMNKLARSLEERGFKVAAIHGNKSQNQRQVALNRFKSDQVQILLATDIASRGLDIDDITHVINYDLPDTYEDYIHRIGRTGRADKKGYAVTLMD